MNGNQIIRIDFTLDEFLILCEWSGRHRMDDDVCRMLSDKVDSKLDRMIRRELYTAVKTAKTPEERARALQQYKAEQASSGCS